MRHTLRLSSKTGRHFDPRLLHLSSYGVDLGALPVEVTKKLPRYPLIPATLIGRLAVDRRYQGQRVGEFLLMDALHRVLVQSAEVAAAAVVVDAIDATAAKFYTHFGFVAFPQSRTAFFPDEDRRRPVSLNHTGAL